MNLKVAPLEWHRLSDGRYKAFPIIGKEFMVVNYGHGWRAYGFPLTHSVSWTNADGPHDSAEKAMDVLQSVWDEFIMAQLVETK